MLPPRERGQDPARDAIEHELTAEPSHALTAEERDAAEHDPGREERVYAPQSERVPKEPLPADRPIVEGAMLEHDEDRLSTFVDPTGSSARSSVHQEGAPARPVFRTTITTTPQESRGSSKKDVALGLGAGSLAAAGGAWWYLRWQRERNRPINRLRRQARRVGTEVGDRVPYAGVLAAYLAERPGRGLGAALLLLGTFLLRTLRRRPASELGSRRLTDHVKTAVDHLADRGDDGPRGMSAATGDRMSRRRDTDGLFAGDERPWRSSAWPRFSRRDEAPPSSTGSPPRADWAAMSMPFERGWTAARPSARLTLVDLLGLTAASAAGYLAWRRLQGRQEQPERPSAITFLGSERAVGRPADVATGRGEPVRATPADSGERVGASAEAQLGTVPVQRGEVEIRKDVVAEERTIEVPKVREDVTVERRPVERRPSDRPIGEGEVVKVPLDEEQVGVEKQPAVYEELDIGTRAIEGTELISGTIRREETETEGERDRKAREGDAGNRRS